MRCIARCVCAPLSYLNTVLTALPITRSTASQNSCPGTSSSTHFVQPRGPRTALNAFVKLGPSRSGLWTAGGRPSSSWRLPDGNFVVAPGRYETEGFHDQPDRAPKRRPVIGRYHHKRQATPGQVLLITNVLIRGDHDLETGRLGNGQQPPFAIWCQPISTAWLTLWPGSRSRRSRARLWSRRMRDKRCLMGVVEGKQLADCLRGHPVVA